MTYQSDTPEQDGAISRGETMKSEARKLFIRMLEEGISVMKINPTNSDETTFEMRVVIYEEGTEDE